MVFWSIFRVPNRLLLLWDLVRCEPTLRKGLGRPDLARPPMRQREGGASRPEPFLPLRPPVDQRRAAHPGTLPGILRRSRVGRTRQTYSGYLLIVGQSR